jgi:uncharacterized protein (DUF4415 family)
MKKKRTSARIHKSDVPYDPKDRSAVAELRARRGRPVKHPSERKQQIALRLDADVLAWYRAQGARWQTKMNAVLRAFRDATI